MQDESNVDYSYEERTKRMDKLDRRISEKNESISNSSDKLGQGSTKVDAEAKIDNTDSTFGEGEYDAYLFLLFF